MDKQEIDQRFKGFKFGSYCWIEQKRYAGAENEFYKYKVIACTLSSSSVRIPIDVGPGGNGENETGHENPNEPCLWVSLVGIVPGKLIKVRVKDVHENHPNSNASKI